MQSARAPPRHILRFPRRGRGCTHRRRREGTLAAAGAPCGGERRRRRRRWRYRDAGLLPAAATATRQQRQRSPALPRASLRRFPANQGCGGSSGEREGKREGEKKKEGKKEGRGKKKKKAHAAENGKSWMLAGFWSQFPPPPSPPRRLLPGHTAGRLPPPAGTGIPTCVRRDPAGFWLR